MNEVISGMRDLTQEEREILEANGIDPEPMRVHYRSDYAMHLRNEKTGMELTVYWGLGTLEGKK